MATATVLWNCNVESSEQITVGSPFTLSCAGEPLQLKRESLNLRRPKENPYALRILNVEELSSTHLKLVATTYIAGKEPLEVTGYAVTDGEGTIEFSPFALNSKSVIAQESQAEPTPYAPYAPVTLSYPLWLWLSLALLVAVIFGAVGRLWYLGYQRKQFLKELQSKSTALGAYHQFQKDLRQITRALPIVHQDQAQQEKWPPAKASQAVQNLQASYHWYLAREFKIPAHKWSANLVQKEIKKQDRKLYRKVESHLQIADRELRSAVRNSSRMSVQDFQQLIELIRKPADVIHLQRKEESRR